METTQPNPRTATMTSPPPPQTFDACDRFFSIDELLTLFLESAPPLVLLNCTRVCTKWNTIITDSPLIQQNLFLEQAESEQGDTTPPRLNPILWQVFGPILATETEPHHSTPSTTYEDLASLPWARDGTTLDARARTAFAREEASWRNMYVSQPPLSRLDWWHTWTVLQPSLTPRARGWGHQDLPDTPLTLGLLWDLLESRLFRGCSARVSYFPSGKDPAEDDTAGKVEKFWGRRGSAGQMRGFTATMGRVKIQTHQVWNARPRAGETFDLQAREWVVGERDYYEGDGFNLLRQDCRQDYDDEGARRWSRHEGFGCAEIHGESSGS